MSIKLTAQSGGSVALDAPTQTTSSADVAFKLPVADGSAGQVLMTDGSGNLSWVTPATTNGITMAQQWRITTNFSVSTSDGDTVLDSNGQWESVDTDGYGTLGSNLTQSNGVFTFPSTGIYLISALGNPESKWPEAATTDIWGIFMRINTTTDGTNYSAAAICQAFIEQPATKLTSMNTHFIFDVTSTSTHKFRISVESEVDSTTFKGDSSKTETGFSVIRLGDT